MSPARPRVVYWAGSGDVKNNFLRWRASERDASIVGVGYSQLVFELCAELGAPLLALTSHPNPVVARNELIRVESVPALFAGKSGIGYHLAQVRAAALLAREAHAFGADVVVTTEEISPAAALPLRALGVELIQVRHCSIWPRRTRPSLFERLRWRVHGQAYRWGFAAVLGVSATVTRQVEEVCRGIAVPTIEFLPLLHASESVAAHPPAPRRPFRVFFAGRIIAEKGVFDVLTLARDLAPHGFEFEICGDGPDLPEVRRRVLAEGLTNVVIQGWCSPERQQERLTRCHAVLVPTTPSFIEGFNKIVVEALHAGRPVVASDVCPAVEYVEDAVCVYRGGDLDGCRRALLELATNAELYARKQAGARRAVRPFLDDRFSLREGLRRVFKALERGRAVESHRILGSAELEQSREARAEPTRLDVDRRLEASL